MAYQATKSRVRTDSYGCISGHIEYSVKLNFDSLSYLRGVTGANVVSEGMVTPSMSQLRAPSVARRREWAR